MKLDSAQDLTIALMLLAGTPSAFAQTPPTASNTATAPLDRAQVKSEARAAEKAGTIPRGDMPAKDAVAPGTGASVNRVAMKTETATFEKSKQPVWMPNSGTYSQANTSKSVATRASVKAEAKAAEANETIPRGEAQTFGSK
jgi:hypothetical protein